MIFDDDAVEAAVQDAAGARQERAAEAFTQAQAGFELFGEVLAPYSPSRKVAAQGMGLLYPFVGEGGAEQLENTGVYPGAVKDTMILCWLCTLPDADKLEKSELAKAWTPSRAIMKPNEALDKAMEWGIAHNLMDVQGPDFDQAYKVFMATVNGISASEFALRLAKESRDSNLPPTPEPEDAPDPKA